jgi:hypothetical protein
MEVLAENKNLFKIERNKNANIIVYDIRLNPDGSINKKNPIDAYWILYAKQGQREEITAFEKKKLTVLMQLTMATIHIT